MSTLILYATGHRPLYSSDEDEIRAISGENARERGGGLGTIDPEDPNSTLVAKLRRFSH